MTEPHAKELDQMRNLYEVRVSNVTKSLDLFKQRHDTLLEQFATLRSEKAILYQRLHDVELVNAKVSEVRIYLRG